MTKQIDSFATAHKAMAEELRGIEANIRDPEAALKRQREEVAKDSRDANRLLHFNKTIEELELRQRENRAVVDQLAGELDVLRRRHTELDTNIAQMAAQQKLAQGRKVSLNASGNATLGDTNLVDLTGYEDDGYQRDLQQVIAEQEKI
jgi:predicted RNase H-like nuclease (RuvC/YqgF family)